jgi:hypothetical protein
MRSETLNADAKSIDKHRICTTCMPGMAQAVV